MILFFVAVVVVYADEGASEGEYLAKSDEDGEMYLAQRRAAEARDKQCAPKGAHCSSDDELKAFHLIKNYELRICHLLGDFCPDELTQGAVLGLVLEVELVLWLLGWILKACCHSRCQLSPVGAILLLVVADRGRSFAIAGGVVLARLFAVRKADLVFLTDTSVDGVHRECIFYLGHSCSAISRIDRRPCRR